MCSTCGFPEDGVFGNTRRLVPTSRLLVINNAGGEKRVYGYLSEIEIEAVILLLGI